MSKYKGDKYCFKTFEADTADFDSSFSEFLNSSYQQGWEYEDCQFHTELGRRSAFCIFERD